MSKEENFIKWFRWNAHCDYVTCKNEESHVT